MVIDDVTQSEQLLHAAVKHTEHKMRIQIMLRYKY